MFCSTNAPSVRLSDVASSPVTTAAAEICTPPGGSWRPVTPFRSKVFRMYWTPAVVFDSSVAPRLRVAVAPTSTV